MIAPDAPRLVLPRPATSATQQLARICVGFVVFVCVMWVAFTGLLWANESRLVFNAGRTRQFPEPLDPAVFHAIRFNSPDGVGLEGATLGAPSGAETFWIVFCPPSGLSIHALRLQDQLQQLRAFGYNVLAFDYRGFGRNTGTPNERGLYADAVGAYRYLTSTLHVAPSHVILAGRSLGSAVAVETALHVSSGGVVLFSPIDSVPHTAARLYPWAPVTWLATNQFDNDAKVARLRVPVLIVHATNDRLIPLSAARALFQRVAAPKAMLETAGGHNRAGFASSMELQDAMRRFWPPLGS